MDIVDTNSTDSEPKKKRALTSTQFEMITERDLHCKVIDFTRKYYPDAIIIPGLGELQQTPSARAEAWKKGYKGGQPDLLIANKGKQHIGLAIEMKTPAGNGKVSENQIVFLTKLEAAGYFVKISKKWTVPVRN